MSVYDKFTKDLLSGKHKLKYENITLAKECITIIQRKLLPKLTDSGMFTIHYLIGSLINGHALCDLGASTNLMV